MEYLERRVTMVNDRLEEVVSAVEPSELSRGASASAPP